MKFDQQQHIVDYVVCARCGVPVCGWGGKAGLVWRHNTGGRKGVTCGRRPIPKIDGKGVITARGIKRLSRR